MIEATLIPVNIEGKQNDLRTTVSFTTPEQARECFKTACERLMAPAAWHKLGGAMTAAFVLCDASGNTLNRPAAVDDLVRIDIPGPGTTTGHGFDWVKVGAIEGAIVGNEQEECGMRLRPTRAPGDKRGDTAHFFEPSASSTFIITRRGNEVTASYHGRNEVPNTHMKKTLDNIRNAVITSGALAGLSEAQWMALIKGFLKNNDEE